MKLFSSLNLAAVNDIKLLTQNTIRNSHNILSKCIEKDYPIKNRIKDLDDISNLICCAIDPLTACSNLHSNLEIQNEANNASKELQVFIDELNNNKDIYDILNEIKSNEILFNSLNYEEQEIINTSLLEIKLSTSIDKTENDRNKIQKLKLDILNKEDEFYRLCHDIQENYIINDDEKLLVNHNNYSIAMKDWKSRNKRKEMYQLFYSNYDIRLNVLQNLRELRHELSLNIGYESFANLKSQTSLFQGDLNKIKQYLLNINKSIEIECKKEIKQLIKHNDNNYLTLYDITYAKKEENKNKNKETSIDNKPFYEYISNNLTIDICLQSLQRLMDICFNIEMDKCLFENDENILKYQLKVPITNEIIGILYFDLYQRENKSISQCITYPLYCSFKQNEENKQIGQCIISMNIPSISTKKITFQELITLYHEFGHSLHYLLSNTQYQTLSGSRGLFMDYLEFPSTFFENFLFDKYFIKYIIMDNEFQFNHFDDNKISIKRNSFYSNLHLMQQIYDSLLDLTLFGDKNEINKSIEEIVYNTYKPLALLMNNDNNDNNNNIDDILNGYLLRTSRFYHFVDYPANYYSYIIAERLSDSIWQNTFGSYNNNNNDTFQDWKKHMRYFGDKLENKILKYGSSKPPLQCLNQFDINQVFDTK